jgi:hypothetical protein
MRPFNVCPLPVTRIVADAEGAWYVIAGKHGWLFGGRADALREKAWLDAQWRAQPRGQRA